MSKWGLLRGMGQGIAQSGNMLMADRLDKMKEERLQKYQQQMQDKQFEREDKVRTEDRQEREVQNAQNISLRAQERLQDQANVDREYDLREGQAQISTSLVNRQIEQINQEIDITGMELDRQRDIQNVWDQIQDTADETELENLFDRYRRLTGTDKDDRYSLHTIPEYDDMGERVGTTVYTHNSRTNEVRPYAAGGGQQVDRAAELRAALGMDQSQEQDMPAEQQQAAQQAQGQNQEPDPYSMEAISSQRGDTGMADRATGLLRRITPNLQPEGQIEQIEARVNMLMQRSDQPAIQNRQLDEQRLALTRLIQSTDTPEEIKQRARALFDQIR